MKENLNQSQSYAGYKKQEDIASHEGKRTVPLMSKSEFISKLQSIQSLEELEDFRTELEKIENRYVVYEDKWKNNISEKSPSDYFLKSETIFNYFDIGEEKLNTKQEAKMPTNLQEAIEHNLPTEPTVESIKELNEENIRAASSIKELSLMLINSDGIESSSQGHFSGADLAFLVQQVSKGDAYIEEVTRQNGLRETVYNLILKEKGITPKSLEHEEENAEQVVEAANEPMEVIEPEPIIPPPPAKKPFVIPLPQQPVNQKPKGFFSKLRGLFK